MAGLCEPGIDWTWILILLLIILIFCVAFSWS